MDRSREVGACPGTPQGRVFSFGYLPLQKHPPFPRHPVFCEALPGQKRTIWAYNIMRRWHPGIRDIIILRSAIRGSFMQDCCSYAYGRSHGECKGQELGTLQVCRRELSHTSHTPSAIRERKGQRNKAAATWELGHSPLLPRLRVRDVIQHKLRWCINEHVVRHRERHGHTVPRLVPTNRAPSSSAWRGARR